MVTSRLVKGSSNYDVQVFDANGAQQNPFAFGDYTVVVTDVNNNCSDELVVTIGEPAVAVDLVILRQRLV